MTTKTLLDGLGASFNGDFNLTLGRAAASAARSFSLCNEDSTTLTAVKTNLDTLVSAANSTAPSPTIVSLQGKPIAASASSFVLGATGAAGDTLSGIVVQPTGTTVGVVTVYDNANLMFTYPGGTVGADLRPIVLPFGMASQSGAWKVNFPANATGIAIGKFT